MQEEKRPVGHKEEITDIFTSDGIKKGIFLNGKPLKKGTLLKFDNNGTITAIKVTRVDRKQGRAWGVHVETMVHNTPLSHYGHNIDQTKETIQKYRAPFCEDCEVPISQPANAAGKKKHQDREDSHLEDGTPIS